jgi:hypothetical protein
VVTLGDSQAFADSPIGKPSSRSRTLAAVKSLLAFGQRTGYLALSVGAALKLPAGKGKLTETDMHWLLAPIGDRSACHHERDQVPPTLASSISS